MIPSTEFCGQIVLDISVLGKIGRVSFFKFQNIIENLIFQGDQKKLAELNIRQHMKNPIKAD